MKKMDVDRLEYRLLDQELAETLLKRFKEIESERFNQGDKEDYKYTEEDVRRLVHNTGLRVFTNMKGDLRVYVTKNKAASFVRFSQPTTIWNWELLRRLFCKCGFRVTKIYYVRTAEMLSLWEKHLIKAKRNSIMQKLSEVKECESDDGPDSHPEQFGEAPSC